jgi:hypothetical protein
MTGDWHGVSQTFIGGEKVAHSVSFRADVDGTALHLTNICPGGGGEATAYGLGMQAEVTDAVLCPIRFQGCESLLIRYSSITININDEVDPPGMYVVASGRAVGCGYDAPTKTTTSVTR